MSISHPHPPGVFDLWALGSSGVLLATLALLTR
jgi:hypothetical protein